MAHKRNSESAIIRLLKRDYRTGAINTFLIPPEANGTAEFESTMVGLYGPYSNFVRPELVPRLRELLTKD